MKRTRADIRIQSRFEDQEPLTWTCAGVVHGDAETGIWRLMYLRAAAEGERPVSETVSVEPGRVVITRAGSDYRVVFETGKPTEKPADSPEESVIPGPGGWLRMTFAPETIRTEVDSRGCLQKLILRYRRAEETATAPLVTVTYTICPQSEY